VGGRRKEGIGSEEREKVRKYHCGRTLEKNWHDKP
jgi:hypothetical protein